VSGTKHVFILSIGVMAMLDGIGTAWKVGRHPPWACERKLEHANLAAGSIGVGGPSGKNNVPDVEDAGVATEGVDELPVPGTIFADKEAGDFMASAKAVS
jgi:hypothetical protein